MGTQEGLVVRNLTVRYGGHTALDGQSLEVPIGAVIGLIGPNGAGKTTTFNAITGVVRPAAGEVSLLGKDITSATPQARALLGLGRTFQRMELFETLSVRENVAMGAEGAMAGRNPLRHVLARRGQRRQALRRADDSMELCGVRHLADARPADLSTGQRRLVELARVTAGEFRLLLLDEPSSGLNGVETERFGEILKLLVLERSLGILLVEHDMKLVMGACDYLYVLDFGKPIFQGTPVEVQQSALVRAAYLGSEAPELVET